MPELHPGTAVAIPDSVPTSDFRCAIPNVRRYQKVNRWETTDVAKAAFEGDFDCLEMLLATGDENSLFNGDLNEHVGTFTPLHLAAQSGHTECIELLLRARADPHMRERMPYGKDPEDGRTALELSREQVWDDCIELLEQAEKDTPYGWYVPSGANNNAKGYRCFQWGTKPPKGWYMSRPGAARKHGLDPTRYGVEDYEDLDEDLLPSSGGAAELDAAPAWTPPAEPPLPIALLFPGQGSQYMGMMGEVKDIPAVQDMLQKAKSILGYDLLQLCQQGAEADLERTDKCQPAMFVAGLAGVEKLRKDRPEAVDRAQCLAGLSLGEYTALCAAGSLDFEDGLRLVQLRAAAMQQAATARPQLMLSVAGLDKAKLVELCDQARRFEGGAAVCQISNELFPKGFSCGGTQKAVEKLKELTEAANALQAKILKTGGGFHTGLMQPAQEKVGQALDEVLPRMRPPRCAVYMNATAAPLPPGTPPREIVALLKRQLTSPVLWEALVRAMINDGAAEFYEVGPMKQLKAMMKRINPKMWNTTYNVDV